MMDNVSKVQGKREMLLFQLRQRFGRLPAATAARIEKATADELNVWSTRVLTASSLGDVLADVAATVPPGKATQPAVRARRAPHGSGHRG